MKRPLAHWVQAAFLLLALGAAGPAESQSTHLGVPTSDLVVLSVVSNTGGTCAQSGLLAGELIQRHLPDATRELFVIPAGRVLVVTDVDWTYKSADGALDAGELQTLRLWAVNENDPVETRDQMAFIPMLLGPRGNNAVSASLASGVAIASGAVPCIDVFPGLDTSPFGVQSLRVRGYLVDEPKKADK